MAADLRDIDLALASYPEAQWGDLAGPVLLARLEPRVGIEEDELYAAVRRATYLAAAAGDPHDGHDPDGPAVTMVAAELETRERRGALSDALRGEVARAVAQRLPRVEHVLRGLAAPSDDPRRPWVLFCAALFSASLAEDEVMGDGA